MSLSFIPIVSPESLSSSFSQPLSLVAEKNAPTQPLRYRMAGLRFDASLDDESLLPLVSQFAQNYWMRAACGHSAADFRLRFIGCDSLPVVSETGNAHEFESDSYVISALHDGPN